MTSDADLPLAGMRCVELSERGSAAYAGKLLHRLGADLVKVESADGDPLRRRGSRRHDSGGATTTAAYDYFNDGKPVRQVDAAGLAELVDGADALVVDIAPADYARWGLDPAALDGLGCRVVCAITPYGLTGPHAGWRGTELTTSARGGMSIGIGEPTRPPLKLPLMQSAIQGGLVAAIATLGRLLDAPLHGETSVIDISEVDVWATIHTGTTVVSFVFSNRQRRREGRRVRGQPYPHQLFRCSDGWIAIQASERHQYAAFVEMVGSPDWAVERRFGSRTTMNREHADEIDALLAPWFAARTRADVFELCRERHIPAAPLRSVREVREAPETEALAALESYDGATGVRVTVPAPPFRFRHAAVRAPGPVAARPDRPTDGGAGR